MEFSNIGKHCEICQQRDFLPIKCNTCGRYFCKDHMAHDNHDCYENFINKKTDNIPEKKKRKN